MKLVKYQLTNQGNYTVWDKIRWMSKTVVREQVRKHVKYHVILLTQSHVMNQIRDGRWKH